MACEGQFACGSKDAHLDAVAALGGGVAREDESGFLESGFAGEGEHFGVGEAAGVGEDDELVAGEALGGEDVHLYVGEAAICGGGAGGGCGVLDQCCACGGGGDTADEGASREFHGRRIVSLRGGRAGDSTKGGAPVTGWRMFWDGWVLNLNPHPSKAEGAAPKCRRSGAFCAARTDLGRVV